MLYERIDLWTVDSTTADPADLIERKEAGWGKNQGLHCSALPFPYPKQRLSNNKRNAVFIPALSHLSSSVRVKPFIRFPVTTPISPRNGPERDHLPPHGRFCRCFAVYISLTCHSRDSLADIIKPLYPSLIPVSLYVLHYASLPPQLDMFL